MSTPRPDAGSPAAPSPETSTPDEGPATVPTTVPDPATAAAPVGEASAVVPPAQQGPVEDPPAPDPATEDLPTDDPPVVRAVDVADPSRVRRAPRYGRFAVVGFLFGAVIAAVLTQFPQDQTPLAQYSPRDVFIILLIGLGTVGVLAGLTWALVSDRRSLRRRR